VTVSEPRGHSISARLTSSQRRPVHILSAGVRPQSYDGVLGVRALGMSAVQFDLKRMVLSWDE
jgi:hypothetical protein